MGAPSPEQRTLVTGTPKANAVLILERTAFVPLCPEPALSQVEGWLMNLARHRRIFKPMHSMTRNRIAVSIAFLLAMILSPSLPAQDSSADPKSIPVIDGGIGPCSADFTVTDATGAPVYDAKVRVHIAYRFMNAHKLDLEVGTNAAGKARFTGLPEKTKQGLVFHASEGGREGSAFDDPAKTCKADLTIALAKKPQ